MDRGKGILDKRMGTNGKRTLSYLPYSLSLSPAPFSVPCFLPSFRSSITLTLSFLPSSSLIPFHFPFFYHLLLPPFPSTFSLPLLHLPPQSHCILSLVYLSPFFAYLANLFLFQMEFNRIFLLFGIGREMRYIRLGARDEGLRTKGEGGEMRCIL